MPSEAIKSRPSMICVKAKLIKNFIRRSRLANRQRSVAGFAQAVFNIDKLAGGFLVTAVGAVGYQLAQDAEFLGGGGPVRQVDCPVGTEPLFLVTFIELVIRGFEAFDDRVVEIRLGVDGVQIEEGFAVSANRFGQVAVADLPFVEFLRGYGKCVLSQGDEFF